MLLLSIKPEQQTSYQGSLFLEEREIQNGDPIK